MNKNKTKNNLVNIILYALAISAALSLNDLVKFIFKNYVTTPGGELGFKIFYVVVMFVGALLLAYYTESSVPI